MHRRTGAWRNVFSALVLVTLTLPLASMSASAQTTSGTGTNFPPSSIAGVGSVAPSVAFNMIGTNHTVTFTCGALAGLGTTTLPAGCYDVSASVQDITTGSAVNIESSTCGITPGGSGTAIDCSGKQSPICPTGTVVPGTTPVTFTGCTPNCPAGFTAASADTCTAAIPGTISASGCTAMGGTVDSTGTICTVIVASTADDTATVTINPGANHAYVITFTGYVPTSSSGSCPSGTTPTTISLTVSLGLPPTSTNLPVAPACQFILAAQKKYVEITNITITSLTPSGAACGGTLAFAEGLKSFFGPTCIVTAVVSGTVVLKSGVNCTDGSEPATGTAAPSEFGPKALYSCVGDTLSVINVTGAGNASLPGVDLAFTGSGVGSFTTVGTLGSLCAGGPGAVTSTAITTGAGAAASFCPTGPGSASIQVCLAIPLPNNQPQVCSTSATVNFTVVSQRVVPYVRWAGEKIELTKCFGVGLAGMPIEFTLKGNNPGLNATLIPVGLAGYSAPTGQATSDTIWTVTDADGCASVIGLADGEGAMYVDAAIFNATAAGVAAGAPLVNEHAFDVFYLKFDHLDLENVKFATYSTAQALLPYLSWASKSPAVAGASPTGSSFRLPGAPGTGQVAGGGPYPVPLCAADFVRAMVHGYFEVDGDPSGRPAAAVAINGAPTGSAGSYVLPAGRWVLPEDWPLLATFAGFANGTPLDVTPSSVFAWDLNSGWVFNPTGEGPDLCGLASSAAAAPANGGGLLLGGPEPLRGQTVGAIKVGPIAQAGQEDVGPCFGQDVTMLGTANFYGTAPGSLLPGTYGGNCDGGFTAGFGPFDAIASCTDPFPLALTPAGASLIGTSAAACGATPIPCLAPVTLDSTYLPNGTLNQWDAPMPPAEVSFAITSGPGSLTEVDKTGFYQINFTTGAGAPCPTGYSVATYDNLCHFELDPDPFYAEAIPASPFIPPVTNNGGYLWNTWNFSAGITTVVRSSPAFASPSGFSADTNPPPGGFVPGQSTIVTSPVATFGAACPLMSAEAGATSGSCTTSGGLNLTAFGATCATPSASVVVADARGFMPGMTVEVYDVTTGLTLVSGGSITAVLPNTTFPSYPNAAELQLSSAPPGCFAADSVIVIGEQFGLPVPGAAAFTIGEAVTIGNAASTTTTTATVTQVDTTNNIVYVDGAEAIAGTFGGCVLSRGTTGTAAFGACEPAALVPPGTVLSAGPVGTSGPLNLYPFWQWVPAPPSSTTGNLTATVYSDNHGEAVVALNTSVSSQVAPVNGACPAPYMPLPNNVQPLTCLLPFQTLATLGYANVAAALSRFSAGNPGCIQTFPSGTFAVLSGATVGASGPTSGQICVNSLGGIEFGSAAALGTTTVQAVADYPYTRGEHPPISSAPLIKVWTSAWAKTLTVSAGSPAPAGTTSYVVTITAVDVCGNPIIGEPIQVYALGNAGAAVLAPLSVGTVISASSNSAVITVRPSDGTATLSLEVLNTAVGTQGLVIKAVFPFELVERFATVISGTTSGQTATVVYAPGWQMIGGPAGSNFSVVEALFNFDAGSQTYTNATAAAGNLSSAPPACTGYWGYFAAAMAVSLPATSQSGQQATCNLAAGWNLIGNPFATPAKLPSGVTAYHWNGTSYDTVGVIPTGGSVWIFNDGTLNSVTLTAT